MGVAAITVINVRLQEFPSSRQDRAKLIVGCFVRDSRSWDRDRQLSQNLLALK